MGNWVEKISCCFHSHSPTESSEKNPTQKTLTTKKLEAFGGVGNAVLGAHSS